MQTFDGEFISAEDGTEESIAGRLTAILIKVKAMKDGDTIVIN